jgi:multimeric flavodoxin WrbA
MSAYNYYESSGGIAMVIEVRILGISGSPRHGNTEILVKEALKAAKELSGVTTEIISLADVRIDGGCKADYACWRKPEEAKCFSYKDDVNSIFGKMMEADGIIIGSPVYWGSIPAQLKCLFDRSMPVEIDFRLRNKVGGAIAVAVERHGGHEGAVADIHRWFLIHDMIICGVGPERPKKTLGGHYGAMALQGYPYPVHSNEPGDDTAVLQDDIGMAATRFLGKRVTELTKVVKAGLAGVSDSEMGWPKGPVHWESLETTWRH